MNEPAKPSSAQEVSIVVQSDSDHAVSSEPEDLIGQTIDGKYLIESHIGGGGMGQVYKARHLHLKSKVVAIKLLQSRGGLDAQQIMRLQKEANAVSYLSHPNIVAVHDFGVSPEGQPYMVMDYFDGRPLNLILEEKGKLGLDALLNIVGQVCSALAHAHEKGVVHRDIKPSNIMVGADEQNGELVKVVDFGIAKLTEEQVDSRLTQTGDVLGSPLYMSPEQCLGQNIDGRTDIYSLGCVMYECVTGKSPFVGANVMETLHKQMNESPAKFPATASDDRRQKGLEAIVFKMLAKARTSRFQYMVEVATELKKLSSISTHSALGQAKVIWELWNARREAKSQRTQLIDGALVVSSVLAAWAAVTMILTPLQIAAIQPESARTATVMNLLDVSMTRLRNPAILKQIIFRDENTVDDKTGLVANFDKMQELCAGHPDEMTTLRALQDSSNHAAAVSTNVNQAMIDLFRAKIFHRAAPAESDDALGTMLVSWCDALAHGNQLYATTTSKHEQCEGQIALCRWLFNVAAVIGLVSMAALAVLLTWKRRLRRQQP